MSTGFRSLRRAALCALVLAPIAADRSEAFDIRSAALGKPGLAEISGTPRATPAPGDFVADVSVPRGKSASRAMLYSLLLPGLGQSYLGEAQQAKLFYGVEAAVVTGFVVFLVQKKLRKDEYIEYAQTFAGLTTADHSDEFYGLLTVHDSSADYEDQIRSEGRLALYPNVDTAALDDYFVRERVADYEAWLWKSADHRRAYQDRRSASRTAGRRALYAGAAALANRVASAFFAYRSGVRNRRASAETSGFSMEWEADERGGEFRAGVSLVRRF